MARSWLVVLALLILTSGCGDRVGVTTTQDFGRKNVSQPGEVGNGGHGIMRQGAIYLVDLVEAGLEKHPYFHYKTPEAVDEERTRFFFNAVKEAFPDGRFPTEKIALKLYDIHGLDPLLAYALCHVMQMYHWELTELPLRPLTLQGSVFDFPEGSTRLVANRRGRSINIHQPFFRLMDAANQTALIFHEMIYALIRPLPMMAKSAEIFDQPAARVREIIAYLFSSKVFFDRLSQEGIQRMVSPEELPVLPPKSYLLVTDADASPDAKGKSTHHLLAGPTYEIVLTVAKEEKKSFSFSGTTAMDLPKELEGICKTIVDNPLGTVKGRVGQKAGGLNVSLDFAGYRTADEQRTYIRFQEEKSFTPVSVNLYYRTSSIAECQADLHSEMWRMILEYEPLNLSSKEERALEAFETGQQNANLDLEAHLNRKSDFLLRESERRAEYHRKRLGLP